MIFCYMDEAGNTGENISDASQPFHYVGGLLVPEKSWKDIPKGLHRIAVDALGEAAANQANFSFHGAHLFAGKPPWNGIAKADRIAILEKCLRLIKSSGCRLIYGRCDKVKLRKYRSPMHPHGVAIWLCYERAAKFANAQDSLLTFIAASGTRSLSKVAEETLDGYRDDGPPFGRPEDLSNVVDTVHFLPSNASPHLQLCDLWLWTTQRFHATTPPQGDIAVLHGIYRQQIYAAVTFPY
jgi:hypothetical protein